MNYKILAINPGSTSTKIAVFQGSQEIFSKNITHDSEKLKEFKEIRDQFQYRKDMILDALHTEGITLETIDAFAGRGGGTTSVEGGVYRVNDQMLTDVKSGKYVQHPANLGCQLADDFAKAYGKPAYIVNPPDTDEFQDLARVSGLRGIYRESKIHALNQKEIGIRYADTLGKQYEDLNLIICHIGGGISVTAHLKGKMVDSNDIAQGDGPMAPTRCGTMPVKEMIQLCYEGDCNEKEMQEKVTKSGGLVDHLGTSDAREVREMMKEGDSYAALIYNAMIYQIGKTAGAMAAVLHGNVDAIILTGGISNDSYVTDTLKDMLSFLAPIVVMPGEFEMEALAAGALRVLEGRETAKEYSGVPVWNGFAV